MLLLDGRGYIGKAEKKDTWWSEKQEINPDSVVKI